MRARLRRVRGRGVLAPQVAARPPVARARGARGVHAAAVGGAPFEFAVVVARHIPPVGACYVAFYNISFSFLIFSIIYVCIVLTLMCRFMAP